MTNHELQEAGRLLVNCELLTLAIETLEKLRHTKLPDDLPDRWIKEMKEEAELQIAEYDELTSSIQQNSRLSCEPQARCDEPPICPPR